MLTATAKLVLHPEAHRVPAMPAEQYAEFLADVRERGVRVPLEVIPGTKTVIDGRSRLQAAKDAGLEVVPVVDANMGTDDPVIYMIRAASKRRQLKDDQRAMLANEEREYLAAKNRKTQTAEAGKASGRARANVENTAIPTFNKEPKDRARTEAAKKHNVSERKVQQAQKVKAADPVLAEKVKAGEVPLAQAARQVDADARQKVMEAKAAAAPEPTGDEWNIINGDCLAMMATLDAASFRLIFADPPYNIGVDYGDGAKADKLTDDKYLSWCLEWMQAAKRLLTADGSLWVLIGDEYADHFGLLLRQAGFHRRAWVKWYETFGVNCSNNFNRCSRHLFYCVRDPKAFVFNPDAVNRPSDRQTKYGDSRANPGGKIWDDVWQIPRLVGTSTERIDGFPTQLPLALLRPIVGCASDPGDRVLDPFNGSGTTGIACLESNRLYTGIERSKTFAEQARKRLRAWTADKRDDHAAEVS